MFARIVLIAIMISILSVTSAHAVHFGWQPLPEGGIEYLVQVEPDVLDSFRQNGITSDLPPGLRDVRRIRLTVNDTRLPNQDDVIGPKPNTSSDLPASGKTDFKTAEAPSNEQAVAAKEPERSGMAGLLQFFHPGPARHINPTEAGPVQSKTEEALPADPSRESIAKPQTSAAAVPAGGMTDRNAPSYIGTSVPKIGETELPKTFGAAKPTESVTTPDSGWTSVPSAEKHSAVDSTPKPWLLLMGALLALFASLGANVYLVWIHQAVRAKYRALVTRMPSQAVA